MSSLLVVASGNHIQCKSDSSLETMQGRDTVATYQWYLANRIAPFSMIVTRLQGHSYAEIFFKYDFRTFAQQLTKFPIELKPRAVPPRLLVYFLPRDAAMLARSW